MLGAIDTVNIIRQENLIQKKKDDPSMTPVKDFNSQRKGYEIDDKEEKLFINGGSAIPKKRRLRKFVNQQEIASLIHTSDLFLDQSLSNKRKKPS